MELILELVLFGVFNLLCFIVGAKVGQKIVKGEDIELPNISLAEYNQAKRDRKAAQEEQDRVNTILANIEAYDGTGRGQQDVPGR